MCDGLIVLSSEWLKIRDITEKPNVILLKNSINLTQYIMLNRSINGSNEKVQIIYLGHIGIDKGIVDLIHAVKFLSSKGVAGYVVSIYGEESRPGELESLIALIRSLSIEDYILLCEPVFNEKKINILQDADIFIFPSHHEGLPISLIEAMAAGLPVIATCVGGIPDLIDNNRNGILVNSQSPDELAEAMKSLIENKQLRHVFGAQGRRKALENHDVENYVNHLINYYQEIIR
jgi:glycosyltransferase involved in cell wall biosynthesis